MAYLDLLNKRFTHLLVTKDLGGIVYRDRQTRLWQCLCDCGNICERSTLQLRNNNSGNFSCGCILNPRLAHNFKGYEDLSGDYWSNLKRKAKTRGIQFDAKLTVQIGWELLVSQNFKCALSDLDIKVIRNYTNNKAQTASLDRIDSDGDYTIDNVQWVHKDINWLKNIFSTDRFIELCTAVANKNSILV